LHRLILSGRLSRNGPSSDLYLRPNTLWLIVPSALENLARIHHVPSDAGVLEQMYTALRVAPEVEPADLRYLPRWIKVSSEAEPRSAVQIKTSGYLSDEEIAALGFHPEEVLIVAPLQAAGEAPP
ncbi:MAG TPA: hypothetical protein VKW04_18685, partial [Planctomycetota bacterium]|nr:hypothetical protein [Planctomycetota bacterium]